MVGRKEGEDWRTRFERRTQNKRERRTKKKKRKKRGGGRGERGERGGMRRIGKIGVARASRRTMRKAINIARLDLGSEPLSGLLTNTEGASINHWTLINERTAK